jgi:hypothetical protein
VCVFCMQCHVPFVQCVPLRVLATYLFPAVQPDASMRGRAESVCGIDTNRSIVFGLCQLWVFLYVC